MFRFPRKPSCPRSHWLRNYRLSVTLRQAELQATQRGRQNLAGSAGGPARRPPGPGASPAAPRAPGARAAAARRGTAASSACASSDPAGSACGRRPLGCEQRCQRCVAQSVHGNQPLNSPTCQNYSDSPLIWAYATPTGLSSEARLPAEEGLRRLAAPGAGVRLALAHRRLL